jgi:hypothetical protein
MDQVDRVSNEFFDEQLVDFVVVEVVDIVAYEPVVVEVHIRIFLKKKNNILSTQLLERDYVVLNSSFHYETYAFYIQHIFQNFA